MSVIGEGQRESPGPDGEWGTDDDSIVAVVIAQCDLGRMITYTQPGTDGVWATVDDHIASQLELSEGVPCANLCETLRSRPHNEHAAFARVPCAPDPLEQRAQFRSGASASRRSIRNAWTHPARCVPPRFPGFVCPRRTPLRD